MVKSDAWKKALDRHGWHDAYASSAQFRNGLEGEIKVYSAILTQLGLAKGSAK
jgi:tripartite-type tricarboxylate transporter receptor subunit TctC